MIVGRSYSALATGGLLLLLSSCALLTKSAPIVPRYFTPELRTSEKRAAPDAALRERRLRLGRVVAGPHLRERMAYRTSEEEAGYYEDRRWTERPEVYLRRALSRSLFEEHGITRAVAGAAPTLDAELVAFEELKGEKHSVRVLVVMSLEDPTTGAVEETITVERDVADDADDDPKPVVRAFSEALAQAVTQIANEVVARLAQLPPPPTPPGPPPGTSSTTITTTTEPR